MTRTSRKSHLGLQLIGGFKFVSGLLLVALGVGLFREIHADPAEVAIRVITALKIDPDNEYIHSAIEKVSGISPRQLKTIGVGTFLYALMYLIEGGGLLMNRHWAEYFTVFATGFFIPLELYEIAKKLSLIRIGVLVINVAIVAYLVYQLRRKQGNEAGSSATGSPP